MPKLSELTSTTTVMHKGLPQGVTRATGKRKVVKRHKDEVIAALTGKQKYHVKRLVNKLLTDYKQVSSKRGSRNFSITRWMDHNI